MNIAALVTFLALTSPFQTANASWLSDITGINIDVPANKVSIGPPNPAAIPQMLANLPKDVVTFLNPAGDALALAIRNAKTNARRYCSPPPAVIIQQLSPIFPANIWDNVCYAVVAPGFTLDNFAIRDAGVSAITFEDVIVFKDNNAAFDRILWAHELTHVLQYRALGIEGFAAIYSSGGSDQLEQQARNFDQFAARYFRQQAGSAPGVMGYAVSIAPGWPYSPIQSSQMSAYARQGISPTDCLRVRDFDQDSDPNPNNGVVVHRTFKSIQNSCPVWIHVSSWTVQLPSGEVRVDSQPCGPIEVNEMSQCRIPPRGTVRMATPPPPAFVQNIEVEFQ